MLICLDMFCFINCCQVICRPTLHGAPPTNPWRSLPEYGPHIVAPWEKIAENTITSNLRPSCPSAYSNNKTSPEILVNHSITDRHG